MAKKSDADKAIDSVLRDINKKFDKKIIGWGHEEEIKAKIHSDKMPWFLPALDVITGGGAPLGKFTTVFGEPGSGKSTAAYQQIAKNQAEDPSARWIINDAESSLDQGYFNSLGGDLSRIIIVPGHLKMEDALESIRKIASTGYITGTLIDSLGGFSPSQEIEERPAQVGLGKEGKTKKPVHADTMVAKPRVVNKFLRIANTELSQFKMATILIGHVYMKIGGRSAYTEYEQAHGTGLKHWAHLRLTTRRVYDKAMKEDVVMPDGKTKECFTGFNSVIRIDKTKQSPTEGHEIHVPFQFGVGFRCDESLVNSALGLGIVEQRGAWYYHPLFPGEKTGIKGKEKARKFMLENPDVLQAMSQTILQRMELQEAPYEPQVTIGDGEL